MEQQQRNRGANDIQRFNACDRIKESIQKVSQNEKFQKKLIIFLLMVSFFYHLLMNASTLYYMNPTFNCENVEGKVNEGVACDMLSFCQIINNQTITAQLNLYCDQRKNDRTLLQTAMGLGNWVGIAFAAIFSDRKGRKLCICAGLVLLNVTCLCHFIGVHLNNISLLILSEFVAGFSTKLILLNCLVLITRFLTKKFYEMGTLAMYIVGYGFCQILIAAIMEFFNNWRIIRYIYSFGIFICSIASFIFLYQDPIYLFDSGRLKESKKVIEAIGEQNDIDFDTNQKNLKSIDDIFENKMRWIETNPSDHSNRFDLHQIIRSDIITKIVIIAAVGCFYLMTTKSIELSIQNLSYSYNFNLLIIGISNICGYFTAIFIIQIFPSRKQGLLIASFIYGILAIFFIFPFCLQNGIIQSILIFCLRFLSCWISNFYTRLKVDCFPQKYQLTTIGIIQSLTNLGNVAGPIIIQMSINNNLNPIFSINILRLIFGALPVLYLIQKKVNLYAEQSQIKHNQNQIQT